MSKSLQEEVAVYQRSCSASQRLASVGELARELGISRVTLSKRFRKEHGRTLIQYFVQERVAYVKKLLITTEFSVATIARQVGYAGERQLHRFFRRETGMTPT